MYIDVAMQGVFFRNFVKEEAKKHELGGFVKGLEDGRIEVFLEGDDVKVAEMIELCRKGLKHEQIEILGVKNYQSIKDKSIREVRNDQSIREVEEAKSIKDKSIKEVKKGDKSFFSKIIDDLSDEK